MEQLKIYEERMNKSLSALQSECVSIRVGHANPHVLGKIKVGYYGTPTPLQQVGNVTVPEARMIQIQPWEKGLLREIKKAIQMSDLGINSANDGDAIRPVLPELTEECRKELVKDMKRKNGATKVAIRNIRRGVNDAIRKLEKSGEISEDERGDAEEQTQKLIDKVMEEVNKTVGDKTEEIMTI